ncbi:MotA/TolQ/ExbB proton channel family protein [Polynucleobacter sp. 30F-ANTBAC]|uniref:MotA/TolQ/ExbB proton channel family protein n=1 Tax=Polynucleobacter sp. 30F-ANTBAC TaxID=2689095 RepID=UPI001C0BE555|nr:MotA/TolQ/ExbB proton channel family protein [Polynucleobacter sp. 30F-ANTBAC]MBU3599089.1 MotA/TolQ/ExbB proton channel family protein [Polynucleobacter sp. 30F-ANTBAC]
MNSFIVNAVLLILIFLSVFTWTIAVVKIKQFKRLTESNQLFQSRFWNAVDWDDGLQIIEENNCEFAKLAKVGIAELKDYEKNPSSLKYMGDAHDILERPIHQEIQKILRTQEKGMAELASIGSTAPFIGLFGTVWGIMVALQEISASGQASIDIVAGPIGEALIATAIGIAAALPAVLFYNYFLRKMKIWITELDGFSDSFLRLACKQITSK